MLVNCKYQESELGFEIATSQSAHSTLDIIMDLVIPIENMRVRKTVFLPKLILILTERIFCEAIKNKETDRFKNFYLK